MVYLVVSESYDVAGSMVLYFHSLSARANIGDEPVVVDRLQFAGTKESPCDRPKPYTKLKAALELGLVHRGVRVGARGAAKAIWISVYAVLFEVFGLKARVLGHTRKHAWTEFLPSCKANTKIGPAFARKSAVRASPTFQTPTDPEKSRKDAPSLGRSPTAHAAAGNEMLISCG